MKSNLQRAVQLCAALSLLLGLSLGQIHKQYKEIQQLKQEKTPVFKIIQANNSSLKTTCFKPRCCKYQ